VEACWQIVRSTQHHANLVFRLQQTSNSTCALADSAASFLKQLRTERCAVAVSQNLSGTR